MHKKSQPPIHYRQDISQTLFDWPKKNVVEQFEKQFKLVHPQNLKKNKNKDLNPADQSPTQMQTVWGGGISKKGSGSNQPNL
jgi:hypothetical protein